MKIHCLVFFYKDVCYFGTIIKCLNSYKKFERVYIALQAAVKKIKLGNLLLRYNFYLSPW